jgi:hypothetical protein
VMMRTATIRSVFVRRRWLLGFIMLGMPALLSQAQRPLTADPAMYGPYSGAFLANGLGLKESISDTQDSLLRADTPWTISCWYRTPEAAEGRELVAGIGDTSSEYPRYLAVDAGHVALWMGSANGVSAAVSLPAGEWHLIAAAFDGHSVTLFADGRRVGQGTGTMGPANALLQMAPTVVAPGAGVHFGGHIAMFEVVRQALDATQIEQQFKARPDFAMMNFEDGSKPWPLQTRQWAGYLAPQAPSTLPVGRAPAQAPQAKSFPAPGASLHKNAEQTWSFDEGWQLQAAPKVAGNGMQISQAGFSTDGWMRATVPGTVLTSMVDDGIYPDPLYGLNNLVIPESLNKQDYWYRNAFAAPFGIVEGAHVELTFEGINYAAEVWLNGKLLGPIKGAFTRGIFDVTGALHPGGGNVLAVKISPPPHPGIPQEESMVAGPGENGGAMELDGPTFLATEGWDWIPSIRDRDSGLWQPVTLKVTSALQLGDAQVVTTLPRHDGTEADLDITVPVINTSSSPVEATLRAVIEQVHLSVTQSFAPGRTLVTLTPKLYPQLALTHPRLWWPNGYGKPELYHLQLTVDTATGAVSDAKDIRFGVREVSYELSLMDAGGHLRRVEYFPSEARGSAKLVVDVSHAGMIEIPSADAIALNIPVDQRDRYPYQSHVSSIEAGQEHSPALAAIPVDGPAPYLVIKVNGVRIAARGGNWGMDDAMKRVSRARLEPYFKLHQQAHLNIIRNWVGQNTEETFYELADEYGMMVWNDFWESTQDYNAEAEDPQLFLANAADTITRFRNHPSIVLWCGRNEGVPQPIINQGLDELTRTLDGTRFYSPSSNRVNLQDSGPYSYQAPERYYRELNRGFSVETGTPSLSTMESIEASIPKADQWPIDDVLAYHDWHQAGNGDVHSFMRTLEAQFGAPTGLADFERKAQMMNYVDYRAIFEGMNANLWAPNSGRLLWMTQPAWPSNHWQILSHDYDTQASFYGGKKACEPMHVQLNLATYGVDIVNTTQQPLSGVAMTAKVYSLANKLLLSVSDRRDVAADAKAASLSLNLAPLLAQGLVFVKLELRAADGTLLSKNLYWLGADAEAYRALSTLASAQLTTVVSHERTTDGMRYHVVLTNAGQAASLSNKLTIVSQKTGQRLLPAYYSDNYVSLLPGESERVDIDVPHPADVGTAEILLRGWNTVPVTLDVH